MTEGLGKYKDESLKANTILFIFWVHMIWLLAEID